MIVVYYPGKDYCPIRSVKRSGRSRPDLPHTWASRRANAREWGFVVVPDDTHVDKRIHCVRNNVIVDRPQLQIDRIEIAADGEDAATVTTADGAPCPEGTRIWVDGELVGTVGTEGFAFCAVRAGTYHLRVEPPFPWAELATLVRVGVVGDEPLSRLVMRG